MAWVRTAVELGVIIKPERGLTDARDETLHPDVVRVLRSKSGMERLQLAHEAWELARDRLAAFVRAKHPDWSEDQVRREVATRLGR